MNTEIKNFNDLDAWQNAHEIVLEIYKITRDLPKDEKELRKVLESSNSKRVSFYLKSKNIKEKPRLSVIVV